MKEKSTLKDVANNYLTHTIAVESSMKSHPFLLKSITRKENNILAKCEETTKNFCFSK